MTRLSIQLIVFGSRATDDLPGVLREVRAAGYDGAEIGEPTDTVDASTLRGYFDAAGLACSGYHTGYAAFLDTDRLTRVAEHMRTVEARHLMCSGVSRRDQVDGYRESAKVLDAAGALLADHGIRLCYHNHHWEFFDLGGGTRGMDILLEETNPRHVACCFDVYWLACAGVDPAAYIGRHADRLAVAHLKDGTFDSVAQRPDTFTELGNGAVTLVAAWDAIRPLAPDWATTEQDRTERTPGESAAISARYARQVLGIGN
ncbi:MAG: sugar phosphate isomerase/epimerase family protein [Armatimonadota bacterium]